KKTFKYKKRRCALVLTHLPEVAKKKIKVGYGTEANEYVLKKYKIAFYASLLHGNIASML
uniref:hypothetical protein n=1 Tax=Bacteroides stercorirosoris TaxID=871324 RepID=UPI0023F29D21